MEEQSSLPVGLAIRAPYVGRDGAADILTKAGFTTAPATLAKLAVSGDGPAFIKFGRQVLYDPAVLLSWAASRAVSRRSTSDVGTPLSVTAFSGNDAASADDPELDARGVS